MTERTAASVVLISDTHFPRRGRDLPPPVWAAIDDADIVIHAGDWVSDALLTSLLDRGFGLSDSSPRRLIACWGNNDGDELRALLPETAVATVAGVRIAVTHETGQADGRERRCESRFPNTDLLVFGHSHIPWDSTTPAGLRLLNPGSPTDPRRQPAGTYITLDLDSGACGNVILHSIDRPSK